MNIGGDHMIFSLDVSIEKETPISGPEISPFDDNMERKGGKGR
jgi:hypothetical protein